MLEMALLKFLWPVHDSSSSPKVVNEVYTELRDTQLQDKGKKWGVYQKLSSKEKTAIGKYASEHGVASAIRRYKDKNLKESSVRDWRVPVTVHLTVLWFCKNNEQAIKIFLSTSVANYITVSHDRYGKRIERIPHFS